MQRVKVQLTFDVNNRCVGVWGMPSRWYQAGDYCDWFMLGEGTEIDVLLTMTRDQVIAFEAGKGK